MEFKDKFLKYLTEAEAGTPSIGKSLAKETKMATAGSGKARDAARKRAERAKAPKKSQLTANELIKQVLAVKTGQGQTELIYKDSYDPNYHEIIDPEKPLSIEDAKAYTKDSTFIQTQASQQLFGNLKAKAEKAERERASKEASGEPTEPGKEEVGPELETKKFEKPKKLSMQDLLASMGTMSPVDMGSIPFDLRQEYFLNNRNPMSDKEFDTLTFETVANQFGIAPKVDLPYNEQVKNALIMLSRLKAGASDQELAFVTGLKNGIFTQFGKDAFAQAKKILSQVGDECLQLMVSASEAGLAGISSEGKTDFKCGEIKFVVNSQGEISLSDMEMNQESKTMRKTINRSLAQVMQDPSIAQKDPAYGETLNSIGQMIASSPTALMSDSTFERLSKDPNMVALMQSEPVISTSGQNLGPMIMPTGELNPAISFKKFEDDMDRTVQKFISLSKSKKSPFMRSLVQTTLANYMRGDGAVDPLNAPSHLVTGNGIFPMSDDYFGSVSSTADISIQRNNKTANTGKTDDVSKFKVVIEQKKDPYQEMREYLYSMMSPVPQTAQEALMGTLSKNYTFDINASLLPGVKPKDLRGVQHNVVRVHGKTFKIPVSRDQELVAMDVDESYVAANSLLVESLENDDVLRSIFEAKLINFADAQNIVAARENGIDSVRQSLIETLDRMSKSISEDPVVIEECHDLLTEGKKKRKRNYKREYKLFHGKPSQIKKRSKRVQARREYEKKGLVHKGDGKDIDHVKPLRNGGGNGKGNLRIRNKSENRSDNGKYKGQPADKPRED